MKAHDIVGFLRVDDAISTGGQPTEPQLEELAREGCEVVINLGLLDPRYCLQDEAACVEENGMMYVHIPVLFDHPTAEDFAAFRAAIAAHRGRKVFVHCAANCRVSAFIALYGEADLGWSRAQADAWSKKLWQPNDTWTQFLADRRRELFSSR